MTADYHSVTISGLKTNQKHQFFIVSRNEQGTSLPTSVITVNISRYVITLLNIMCPLKDVYFPARILNLCYVFVLFRSDWNGQLIHGRPSPPHEVATSVGADFIVVSWTPPTISDAEDYHKYR